MSHPQRPIVCKILIDPGKWRAILVHVREGQLPYSSYVFGHIGLHSLDPDKKPQNAASDQSLQCLVSSSRFRYKVKFDLLNF